jgi:acyl carrier protein
VKISGFRIELGDIENHLVSHEDIREAVVLSREDSDGERFLCAYFVAEIELAISEIRDYLKKILPGYMIPLYFMRIDEIPLTPNGKINRKALPVPEIGADAQFATPGNYIEKILAEIWSEVLNIDVDKISIHVNFFELGGHSLKATNVISKIHRELEVKVSLSVFFGKPTIRELSEYIRTENKAAVESIPNVEKREYYPLSSAQKRLYFLQLTEPDITTYNCMLTYPFPKKVTNPQIEFILKKIIKRHDTFRTSFPIVDGVPMQKIHENISFEIEYHETGGVKSKVEKIIKDFVKPFDLSRVPIFRAGIMEVRQGINLLVIDIHHIVADGSSLQLMERDFSSLGGGIELPSLRIQYKDYSEWQNSESQKEAITHQKEYWLNKFSGDLPILNLPVDYQRKPGFNFKGGTVRFEIEEEQTGSLYEIANLYNATLFMVLVACYAIFLAKLSDQEDIIIGTAFSGRKNPELENVVGMLANTIAIRSFPHGEETFIDFLKELKNITLEAFENEDFQFDDIVDALIIDRELNKNPLFSAVFGLQNFTPGLTVDANDKEPEDSSPYENETAKFDLTLITYEMGKYLSCVFEYDSNLFKEETVKRFVPYLKNILSAVIKENEIKLADIKIDYGLSDPEQKKLEINFSL